MGSRWVRCCCRYVGRCFSGDGAGAVHVGHHLLFWAQAQPNRCCSIQWKGRAPRGHDVLLISGGHQSRALCPADCSLGTQNQSRNDFVFHRKRSVAFLTPHFPMFPSLMQLMKALCPIDRVRSRGPCTGMQVRMQAGAALRGSVSWREMETIPTILWSLFCSWRRVFPVDCCCRP